MADDQATQKRWKQLTTNFKTQGLEDIDVSTVRTVTVGGDLASYCETPAELVTHLPCLVSDNKASGRLAELEMKEVLGEGGMGLVRLAEQLSLGREVAVKQVRSQVQSEKATLVLLREGWTTGILEHPNIVPVHSLGRDANGEPIIVMKRISGTSWREIIEDPECTPPGFDFQNPIDIHVEILSQICNAIHYAHSQGIIHRDLKPDNVMVGEFGEVYVLDWGIAVSIEDDPTGRLARAEDEDMPVGTPAYMAPEMVDSDNGPLGVHTDIFLLGAMLKEALTGEPPYSGGTLFQLMFAAHMCKPPTFDETTPPELVAICERAMARDPEQRFDDARQLREALLDFRTNRESRRLAEQGELRLAELQEQLLVEQDEDEEEIDEHRLYKLFSECRFAFEQSREINAENIRALSGLQQALEVMADRELNQDAHKAASLLIADLPQPNPDLSQRLQELASRLASRDEDFEALRQISHDVDVEVGRSSRAVFAMAMGVFWALASLLMAILVEGGTIELSHEKTFAHIVALTGLIAAVVYFGREWFFENELNKRILVAAVATFGCVMVHRGLAWLSDIPFRTAVAHEMLIYGMGTIITGVALDRRLIWVGMPFVVGAVLGAAWPAAMYWLFVPVNLAATAIVGWVWLRDNPTPA